MVNVAHTALWMKLEHNARARLFANTNLIIEFARHDGFMMYLFPKPFRHHDHSTSVVMIHLTLAPSVWPGRFYALERMFCCPESIASVA